MIPLNPISSGHFLVYVHAPSHNIVAILVSGIKVLKEWERMARVTLATAELQAAQKMIDVASLYEKSPRGMGLRWMGILYEIGQQLGTNTIMLIPSTMPEAGVPTVGMFGFRPISEKKPPSSRSKKKEKTATAHAES